MSLTMDDRFLALRCSTMTDSTAMSSRYHGRNRPRRRKHRLPLGFDRVNILFNYFLYSYAFQFRFPLSVVSIQNQP